MRWLGCLLIAGLFATSGCCASCGGPPIPGFGMRQAPAEAIAELPSPVPPAQTHTATVQLASHVE